MAKARKTEQETKKPAAAPKAEKAEKKPAAKPKAAAEKTAVKKAAAPKAASPAKAKTAVKADDAVKPAKAPAARKPVAKKAAAPVEPVPAPAPARKTAPGKLASPKELLTLDDDQTELPQEYGDTKVVLLNRDPEWIFAYWEINRATRKRFNIERGQHSKQFVLRLHELKAGGGEGPVTDTSVNDYTSSWYLRIPNTLSRYRVELGLFDEKGKFQSIATSNPIEIPRMSISEETDVEFAEINDEIYSQIVHLSGGLHIRERLGSDEFLRSLQQRVLESLSIGPNSSGGVSSSSLFAPSSFGLSSGSLSSGSLTSTFFTTGMAPGAGGEGALARPQGKDRDFWLEVGVDVIVYGATEPDAKVKFMGQEIRLTPDGTFRVRMVFPDATIEFPIEATSADGKQKRAVKPVVKRHTEGNPRKPAK